MPKNKKILFLDILGGNKNKNLELEKRIYNGKTYGEYFRLRFKIARRDFLELSALKGKFPDPRKFRAIIMGGSLADVTKKREHPWIEKTFSFIRRAERAGTPILGFCGGLQFTVRALGGSVVLNPKGRDMGTKRVALSSAGQKDFLFKGLPKTIFFQESHKCMAKNLKPHWKLLARSPHTPIEALAIGDKIRLVQFHPELRRTHILRLAHMRKNTLIEEGFIKKDTFPRFISSLRNADKIGERVVRNFFERFPG